MPADPLARRRAVAGAGPVRLPLISVRIGDADDHCSDAITRTAARQLAETLPNSVAVACVEFLYGPLSENPHRVGAPLRKPFEGHRRAHRGEYRVRYMIDNARAEIVVPDISRRRDAYR